MRNDQIFVLLLVVLLPMSGCFDGAVGDAEATDDETPSVEHIEPLYSISIDDYLQLLGNDLLSVMDTVTNLNSYTKTSVFIVYSILEKLEQNANNKNAIKLIHLLSMMDGRKISKSFLLLSNIWEDFF